MSIPQVGEIRVATRHNQESRLVYVYAVDGKVANVMLISNETEQACDVDIVANVTLDPFHHENDPFEIKLLFQTDIVSFIEYAQLKEMCMGINDELMKTIEDANMGVWLPIRGENDPRWVFKTSELKALHNLCNPTTSKM